MCALSSLEVGMACSTTTDAASPRTDQRLARLTWWLVHFMMWEGLQCLIVDLVALHGRCMYRIEVFPLPRVTGSSPNGLSLEA